MNAIINSSALSVGLLVMFAMLVALVLYNRNRKLKPQIAGYGSQRMCPSCGLITPRSKASCVECGKMLGLN